MPRSKKKPAKTKTSRKTKTKVSHPKARRAKASPGVTAKSTKGKAGVASVLNSEKLQELYATMLKCRMLNERGLAALNGRGSSIAATTGHEAVFVGTVAHALPADAIAAAQNESLASFVQGVPLQSILKQAADQQLPSSRTSHRNGSNSLGEEVMARGVTLATEQKGNPAAVLVFTGDDHEARSAHREQLGVAAKNKLAVVCVMESRLTSLISADGSSPANSVADGSYFPQIAVDGNDVVAVFRVAQEAIRRARTGHGPSLIECVMPDSTPSIAANTTGDPLAFMQQYLQRRNLWSDDWRQRIIQEFTQELDAAITALKSESSQQNRSDLGYSQDRSAKLNPEPASA